MEHLLSFTSGHEHYAQCHDVFKEKSGAFGKNKEILNLHLPSVVSQILQTSRDVQFNVLSVGSGDGATDSEILKIVQTELQRRNEYRDMKIFIRAVEPNRHHIGLYKKAIEKLPESLKHKTTLNVREETFQEYTQHNQEYTAMKFDLIFFYHSIYYMDVEQTLKHCFEKELRENGQVVVVFSGKKDLIRSVILAEVSTDEVIYMILDNGWKYDTFSHDYDIDVTEVFNENSIQGNRLLDFMTHFVHFRDTAPDKDHIDRVLSLMQRETVVREGKRFGKKSDVIFVMRLK